MTPAPVDPTVAPPAISVLLASRHLGHALICLASLTACAAEGFRLQLHDDGSLTDQDEARLLESLPNVVLIRRGSIDGEVDARLSRHPHCLNLRRHHPILMKLLDLTLLAPDEIVRIVDSDVYFLRRFRGLLGLPANADLIFAADSQSAYSIRSWQLLTSRLPRPIARVNTGVALARKSVLDLDLVEHFLSRWRNFAPMWLEQTAWALLAGEHPTHLFDARQVRIFDPACAMTADAVALHFVSPVRGHLQEIAHRGGPIEDRPIVPLETAAARRLRIHELASDEMRRLRRRLTARPLSRHPSS